ncbi:MAG TPA: DUF3256 family protein [Paludibacter sp.]
MTRLKLNKCAIVCLMILSSVAVFSQNIEKCYINMPERLNPVVPQKSRLELLEYHKAGQSDSIQNRFGNQVVLQVFDTLNNRIVVKNTESTTFEMKLLKTETGVPVVGLIRTVCSPICQSTVEFYDTVWNVIPLQFVMPKAIQWINKEKLAGNPDLDKVWVANVLENGFISLQFDAANQYIIATNNSAEFLDDKDRKVILPLLNEQPVIYELKGRTWVQKP